MTGMMSYTNLQTVGYSAIYTYIGYMVLYLMAIQLSVTFITHLVRGQITSVLIASAVVMFTLLSSGLTVHSLDLGSYIKWMELTSPLRWLLPVITAKEFNPETIQATTSHLLCRNKQVQNQDIIVQMQCPPPNGTHALASFRLLPENHALDPRDMETSTALALALTCVGAVILTIAAFTAKCSSSCRSNKRKQTRL
ncbi:uncharacterized protein LOC113375818 [Ctenocephalides felis]|uniref:uncharacterized protein LOC113375818 n=1 Tax=Ctenocephalides felis TaxID=7515 RepID=UPI000E6E3B4E|nr:uncharacterized protein LOC113375818 [Ctenocephalides felis]